MGTKEFISLGVKCGPRVVVSGELFCLARRPFLNPSMVFRRRVRVWTLSLATRNDTDAPITYPFLGRIFLLTSLSINPLSGGLMIETFHVDSHCPECILGDS